MKDKMNDGLAVMIGVGEPKMGGGMHGKHMMDVPLASLKVNGGDGEVAPEVGDMVDFTASGKVVSVDGDNAKIEVMKSNGADMPMMEEEEKEPDAESLMAAAEKEDENYGG